MRVKNEGISISNAEAKQLRVSPEMMNSATVWSGMKLLLFMFFVVSMTQAQNITIDEGVSSVYCNSVVTLTAPFGATDSYSWQAEGAVLLRKVGSADRGQGAISILESNKVELVVNGAGAIKMTCITCAVIPPNMFPTAEIDITPVRRPFNPTVTVSNSSVAPFPANGIQTKHPWICLSNDSSVETITVTNASDFKIFWSVTGGAVEVDRSYEQVGDKWVAKVMIQTTGSDAKKGFLRAYVADSCGNIDCGSGGFIAWEILKDIVPETIFGVTCLRDTNLDASRSTVYSVPDQIAGNAVFAWKLIDKDGDEVGLNDPRFGIESKVLYGNSATITYKNGHTPSSVGDFTVKVSNKCGGEFARTITVSPEAPLASKDTYCAGASIGDELEVAVKLPKAGKTYTWTVKKNVDENVNENVDWEVIPNTDGSIARVKFNDTKGGVLLLKAINSDDPTCISDVTVVSVNRNGGDVSVAGPDCIQRNTTDAFTFTASPFGQFDWEVTPALPSGWVLSNGGNILTITPPLSGINVSGVYRVTATLDGCDANNTDSFDFEIGPAKPVVDGDVCVDSGATSSYTIISGGATRAEVKIISQGVVVSDTEISLPNPLEFTAMNEDYRIEVVTYSASGCASLPTVLEVKVRPVVAEIVADDLCIAFESTPTVTFRANTTGTVTAYRWDYPRQWRKIGGGSAGDDYVTLVLDASTAGEVCLRLYNETCQGETVCLDIPRNALDVSFSKFKFAPGFYSVTAKANVPLIMNWTDGENEADVLKCRGDRLGDIETTPSISSTRGYISFQAPSPWMSVNVFDPVTGCERCFVFNVEVGVSETSGQGLRGKSARQAKKANVELQVLPNPVQDILNVSVPLGVSIRGMALLDAKGKLVFSKSTVQNEEKIDVSSYAKGLYFLHILTDKGVQSEKIVIKK